MYTVNAVWNKDLIQKHQTNNAFKDLIQKHQTKNAFKDLIQKHQTNNAFKDLMQKHQTNNSFLENGRVKSFVPQSYRFLVPDVLKHLHRCSVPNPLTSRYIQAHVVLQCIAVCCSVLHYVAVSCLRSRYIQAHV